MLGINRLPLIGLILLGANASSAQPAIEAFYLENSVLPGASSLPGFQTTDLVRNNGSRRASVNAYGDFVAPVHTKLGNFDAENNTIFYHFGAVDGATPAAIRREAMLSGVNQNLFGGAIGIAADGTITYTASLGTGLSGLASLWQGDTLIYQEGDAIAAGSLAGQFYGGTAANVFTSPSGQVRWRMNYSTTSLGTEVGTAIVQGLTSPEPIIKSGDSIGTLGNVVANGSAFTNPSYSIAGSNFISAVELDTNDEVIVLNSQPLNFTGGGPLVEGALIPASAGGMTDDGMMTGTPIEEFRIGTNFATNEAGDFALNAFTELTNDGNTNVDDDVLLYNGSILFREGDTVDGVTLSGQFEGLGLNDRGDLVFGWDDQLFLWNAQNYPQGKLLAEIGTALTLPDGNMGSLRRIAVGQLTVTNQLADGTTDIPVAYFGGSTNPSDLSALMRLVPMESPTGDYNSDGVVDLADYTLWRNNLGSTTHLEADGDRNGSVGNEDYQVWRINFGASSSALEASANVGAAVPEPPSMFLILQLIIGTVLVVANSRK